MTLTNAYATSVQLQQAFRTIGSQNVDTDTYDLALNAASRMIDNHCGRRFYDDDSATARWFTPAHSGLVMVDDFYTTSGLVIAVDTDGDGDTDETWTSDYYHLSPINGVNAAGHAWPYTAIRARPGYSFAVVGDVPTVSVTAKWGWTSVPSEVEQATIVQAVQLLKSPDAPFGVAGSSEFGVMRIQARLHPTAAVLLTDFVKRPVGVA